MKLIAKASGDSDRPLPAAGMQQGVLYSIIVLGTQKTEYMRKVKKQFKFNVSWELPHLPKLEYEDDNGQKILRPQCVFKTYTRSLYAKSNLAQDLSGWRGVDFSKEEENGFDVFTILKPGLNALLQITHYEGNEGKMRAKYISMSQLMPGMTEKIPENPIVEYEPTMLDNFPEGMPDWAQEAVVKSPEYQAMKRGEKIPVDYSESKQMADEFAQEHDLDEPKPTDDDIPF